MKDIIKEKLKKILENIKWIILAISIIIFLIILKNIKSNDIIILDNFGYGIVSKYLIHNRITPIVKIFTNFAGMIWLIGLTIFLIAIIKKRKLGISIFINLCLSASINYIIKQILQRPRPLEEYRIIEENGYSFPSGHSMVSMAFYGYFIYLINKKINNKYVKIFSTIGLSCLILGIGISRIYLGVHYTSDVIAGFLVGIAYLIIYISIIKLNLLCENKEK